MPTDVKNMSSVGRPRDTKRIHLTLTFAALFLTGGLWLQEQRALPGPGVPFDYTTGCVNASIDYEGRHYTSSTWVPESWDRRSHVPGTLHADGDRAVFIADDGTRIDFRSQNWSKLDCYLRD